MIVCLFYEGAVFGLLVFDSRNFNWILGLLIQFVLNQPPVHQLQHMFQPRWLPCGPGCIIAKRHLYLKIDRRRQTKKGEERGEKSKVSEY